MEKTIKKIAKFRPPRHGNSLKNRNFAPDLIIPCMDIQTIEKEKGVKQLEIHIEPEDFRPKLEQDLKKIRKQTQMPGFRPGKVPMSLIRKQYEKPAKIQAINALVEKALEDYVKENDVQLLGSFVPSSEQETYTFDEDRFVFKYDFAELPEVEIDYETLKKIPLYQFVHTDEDVENEIKYYRERASKWEETDVIADGHVVLFSIENADKSKGHAEYARMDFSKKKLKSLLENKKAGETFEMKLSGAAKLFDWKEETVKAMEEKGFAPDEKLTFKVDKIYKQVLPEVDAEFFKQIFPDKKIETEAEFKEAVREKLDEEGKTIGLNLYKNEIGKKLGEVIRVEFPEEFMIRWLQSAGKEKISEEEARKIYEDSLEAYKLDVARSKIIKESGKKISDADVMIEAKARILNYYLSNPQYAQLAPNEEQLEQMAREFLGDKHFADEVYSQLTYDLFMDVLVEKTGKKPKKVNWSEYDEIIKKLSAKSGDKEKKKKTAKKSAAKSKTDKKEKTTAKSEKQ